ncbi:MAG: DUF1353 domain-containing protein [Alphaproteobacteria bacterium]|nr:MAG: DUF1353 domain-containing protein [Alphaproteobacteria bacterium]
MNDTNDEHPAPDFACAAEAPPQHRITQAWFQAARQSSRLSPEERRANRHALRRNPLPPGWIADRWLVVRRFVYSFGSSESRETYSVPDGFEFDGASVPLFFTILVPRSHSDLLAAAALHDYLYAERHADVPRPRADAIFREALQVLGLNWFWASVMWRAVRIGGWVPWYKRKPDTLPGRILGLPWLLRWTIILPVMIVTTLTGVVADLVSLVHFRAEGRRIMAEDSEENR